LKNQKLLYILIFIFGIGLGGFFFYKGFKSPKHHIEENLNLHADHSDHSTEITYNSDSLDNVVNIAVSNLLKGKEENDPVLMMQQGIFILRDALTLNPKHEMANYHMALLNLERGIAANDKEQILKAQEKVNLLLEIAPNNDDYLNLKKKIEEKL
jgi:hypothetical protein